MAKRENIKTAPRQIVEYWSKKVSEMDISVDWSEAEKYCWRCGNSENLQRAHIVPDSLGGFDSPDNLILLCEKCHTEAPNVTDPEIMWDWLKAYNSYRLYSLGTLMALREYEFIYKSSFESDLQYILEKTERTIDEFDCGEMKKLLISKGEETSTHFGQSNINTSTFTGMMRMFLKDLACKYDVNF